MRRWTRRPGISLRDDDYSVHIGVEVVGVGIYPGLLERVPVHHGRRRASWAPRALRVERRALEAAVVCDDSVRLLVPIDPDDSAACLDRYPVRAVDDAARLNTEVTGGKRGCGRWPRHDLYDRCLRDRYHRGRDDW